MLLWCVIFRATRLLLHVEVQINEAGDPFKTPTYRQEDQGVFKRFLSWFQMFTQRLHGVKRPGFGPLVLRNSQACDTFWQPGLALLMRSRFRTHNTRCDGIKLELMQQRIWVPCVAPPTVRGLQESKALMVAL